MLDELYRLFQYRALENRKDYSVLCLSANGGGIVESLSGNVTVQWDTTEDGIKLLSFQDDITTLISLYKKWAQKASKRAICLHVELDNSGSVKNWSNTQTFFFWTNTKEGCRQLREAIYAID